MSLRKVPALDLNDYLSSNETVKQKFVKDLYSSVKEYGFVVFNSHPVSDELLNKAYRLQKELFDLPDDVKMKYFGNNGGQRGYTPFGTEHAKGSKVNDLKEFWHVGRELSKEDKEEYPENIWPSEIKEFKETFLEIYNKLEEMANLILEALESSLGVEHGFFKPKMEKGNSILRMLHYPPVAEGVEPAAIRAGAHSDIDTLTLLVSGTTNGLELLDKNGEWIPVESGGNSLFVNIGDMLARMTNDQVPSTIHRVVNPDKTKNVSRYSMPFFHHYRSEVPLKVIEKYKMNPDKYPEITANEFLMERLREIGLKK